jgi:hydrogenase maturation protein HypF
MQAHHIIIEGMVQGVGFRPYVYTLADKLGLKGKVWNSANGLEILLDAKEEKVKHFLELLTSDCPPHAKIDQIKSAVVPISENFSDLTIENSSASKRDQSVIIPQDLALCDKCKQELFDPENRRYRYPFISCVECGPRYTILKNLPYDRANTSMDTFTLCEACKSEYNDPANRRFHAQNISCPECGPSITLFDKSSKQTKGRKALELLLKALEDGNIAAVKGVGGYHLLCDATHTDAVKRLRILKKRPFKPFAVMVANIEDAKALIEIDSDEEVLLKGAQKPIVVGRKSNRNILAEEIAPHIDKLGVMLAYTPLHLMLLNLFEKPLVATSANISSAPICATHEEIMNHQELWDLCLDHDLQIINRCDDSVVMGVEGNTVVLRSARGFAPAHFKLPCKTTSNMLLLGSDHKNSIAISFDNHLIVSPYLGDLDSIESIEHFEKNIEFFQRVYRFTPDTLVCDKHPSYQTRKWARSKETDNIIEVQHHVAHLASVMLEREIDEEVLGVAFDGTGYGNNGTLWGGEFFRCTPQHYQRIAHLKPFKLLGGEAAIKEPRRVALSLLFSLYGKRAIEMQNPTIDAFDRVALENLYKAYEKALNTPLSGSVGRLFDAVASLTGICQKITYEGESGLRMEAYYNEEIKDHYPFDTVDGVIDWSMMIEGISHEARPDVAISKFFNTLVEIIYTIYNAEGLRPVLSGGVFQNRTLLQLINKKISDVIVGGEVPVNDGGIATGQAAYAIHDHLHYSEPENGTV